MKLMIPFTPHLANECLELLKCKILINGQKLDKSKIINKKLKFAVQINGKTRDIIQVKKRFR